MMQENCNPERVSEYCFMSLSAHWGNIAIEGTPKPGLLALHGRVLEYIFYAVYLLLLPPNYSIKIFTHLKLCLADAIHNFKWVKIIKIWPNGGQQISNLAE